MHLIRKCRYGPKLHFLKIVETFRYLGEMLVNKFSFLAKFLVLLVAIVLAFILLPKLNFITWLKNSFNFFFIVVSLSHCLATFSKGSLKSGLKRIYEITELCILLGAFFDITKEDGCVDGVDI